MASEDDLYTVEFPLNCVEACVFMFGKIDGWNVWRALNTPIEPRMSSFIEGLETPIQNDLSDPCLK